MGDTIAVVEDQPAFVCGNSGRTVLYADNNRHDATSRSLGTIMAVQDLRCHHWDRHPVSFLPLWFIQNVANLHRQNCWYPFTPADMAEGA